MSSVFLGSLSLLAVLCFHFPEYLTTPALRESYDVDLLRRLLSGAMAVGAEFIEVMFAADLVQYWGHRMMHENKYLWNVHAVHHCPARMDWLSGSRIHFGEVLFTRCTVILPIYLLGFAAGAVNAYVIWVGIQGLLIHANTSIPFGPLRYVFATPHFHHWHHSADAEAIDKNYAANLPVLDMLFGTYIDNGGRWPQRYGVVGKPLPHGFIAQHLYPFIAPAKVEPASAAAEDNTLARGRDKRPVAGAK